MILHQIQKVYLDHINLVRFFVLLMASFFEHHGYMKVKFTLQTYQLNLDYISLDLPSILKVSLFSLKF